MWCLRQVWALFNLLTPSLSLGCSPDGGVTIDPVCSSINEFLRIHCLKNRWILVFSLWMLSSLQILLSSLWENCLAPASRPELSAWYIAPFQTAKDTEWVFVEKGWIPIAIFSSRCVVDKAGKNNHKRSFRADLLLGYILMLFLHVWPWKFNLNIVCICSSMAYRW